MVSNLISALAIYTNTQVTNNIVQTIMTSGKFIGHYLKYHCIIVSLVIGNISLGYLFI
jgi:hypothetical protein